MENKSLKFQYSDDRQVSIVLKKAEQSPYLVQVDILPPDGEAKITAGPVHRNGKSFKDALIELRKAKRDYCDDGVWDDMEKTCVIADEYIQLFDEYYDFKIDSSLSDDQRNKISIEKYQGKISEGARKKFVDMYSPDSNTFSKEEILCAMLEEQKNL